MAVIDPMHNLYIGTAKHIINIWIKQGLITNADLKVIQDRVDSIQLPSYVGRIPL